MENESEPEPKAPAWAENSESDALIRKKALINV